jgi:hypothetical protein
MYTWIYDYFINTIWFVLGTMVVTGVLIFIYGYFGTNVA